LVFGDCLGPETFFDFAVSVLLAIVVSPLSLRKFTLSGQIFHIQKHLLYISKPKSFVPRVLKCLERMKLPARDLVLL
jgi:hypothetical protein